MLYSQKVEEGKSAVVYVDHYDDEEKDQFL